MADDKDGREKQAADEERRQRKRAVQEALARGDESEPSDSVPGTTPDESDPEGTLAVPDGADPGRHLGDLDEALATQEYPVTGEELRSAVGEYRVESQDGYRSVGDVLAPLESETFASADEVRRRLLGLLQRR